MDPWTTQSGYPYINVTVNKETVQITQKRFLVKNIEHNDTIMWPIPITFATKASEFENTKASASHIYYKEDGQTKTIKLPVAPPTYLIVNNQQTGYYRVNYDTENWLKIKATLKSDSFMDIHVLNRAQIVDDLFNFARAGLLDYTFALDIVDYVQNEKSYIPWVSTFNGLGHLSRRLTTADDVTLLKSYVLSVLSKIYAHLGYYPNVEDKQTDIYNRVNVLNWLCKYDHADCLNHTREEWTNFVASPITYKYE
jgi:aminopeptidase N